MYTVTRIEDKDRRRKKVYLDDVFAFVLYHAEMRTYGVEEGGTLSGEAYAEIVGEVLPKRAKLRAMHLLEKRPYTERALREKLADGDAPPQAIDEAIEYVKSFGYVDDLRYAIDHISCHIEDRNRKRLTLDLMKKGVDKALIAQAFDVCEAESADADGKTGGEGARMREEKMIRRELEKKHYDPAAATYETRAKICASLVRKGFDADLVRGLL